MKKSRFIIGIDLGTTNSTLSYIDTDESDGKIRTFSILQLVGEGTIKDRDALPSFLYFPGEYELPEGSGALAWDKNPAHITGEFARIQGTKVPSNLVSSAKSWLCHNRVDRKGPILPWGMEKTGKRISPVEASSFYPAHMKDAWNYKMAGGDKDKLLENQQIIITIPASFDESARELTAEAVNMAGIDDFSMIEEPQAAFYAWISAHEKDWSELVRKDSLILVFDVGGGTTDFTLISIVDEKGTPSFRRVAVGDHILLGGDNMDLTLARKIEKELMGKSGKFSFQQWISTTGQCRTAKEELLGDPQNESMPITVLGTGKSVIGGTRKVELTTGEINDCITEGFFRNVEIGEDIDKGKISGLQELGLPFVSDTAIMKHLSSFLKRHSVNKELSRAVDNKSGASVIRPDILLFNGGVFKSPVIREHAAGIIRNWFNDGTWTLTVIENKEFNQAVSIGAAYYGLVLRGKGQRISGGTGKAYYIAVEKAGKQNESALKEPVTLVCIVPRGVEEGEEIHLSEQEFQVMTNSPVSFTIYSSSYRAGDRTGDVITAEREEFIELPPIRTVLQYGKKTSSVKIPVSLGTRLNEFGTLDVWCESRQTSHRWKLAFQIRMDTEEGGITGMDKGISHNLDESTIDQAIELMEKAFHGSSSSPSEVTPENLIKKMEEVLSLNRKSWNLFAIRKMWDALFDLKEKRLTTAMHEARWLNLSGFLLRPGFGYQLDDWRLKEMWKLFLGGLKFDNNAQCRSEWWIHWRRIAGGLDVSKQGVVFQRISPWLLPSGKKTKKLPAAEINEKWMLAASLENLSPAAKVQLGDRLAGNLKNLKGKSLEHYYWAISRIGARTPFHGEIDKVAPRESVEGWIEVLLDSKWQVPKKIGYALSQMSRKTGDRLRNIDSKLAERTIDKLSQFNWSEHYIHQIKEHVPLQWEDEKKIFGESLPAGLYING